MKFWEALKEATENGKRIRYDNWGDDIYLYVNKDDGYLYWHSGEICEEVIDTISNKWEIYEEKKDVDEDFKEFYHYLKDENGFANGQYCEFIYNRNLKDHLLEFYQQLLEMAKYYKLD